MTTTPLEIRQEPKLVPLYWVVGDALRFALTILDPDPDSPDPQNPVMVPRDLTGWSVAAQIRKKADVTLPLLAEFAFNTLDNTGRIEAYLSPTESAKLRGTKAARWDYQLTDPSGDPLTIMAGPAGPEGDVTE